MFSKRNRGREIKQSNKILLNGCKPNKKNTNNSNNLKDSLQVEINMLEEKLSETVKMISNDYENKVKIIKIHSLVTKLTYS